MIGKVLALSFALSAALDGTAQARQDPDDPGQGRAVTFRSLALEGEVTLRLIEAGAPARADERPTAVMFLVPAESDALVAGLNRCGGDREACGFAAPAHRVTVVRVEPAQVSELASRRPDPEAATAEFLAVELPEWLFANVEPDDMMLIAGGIEGVDALRGALRQPGAYDELLLLEPDLKPDVALLLMSTIPPFSGETTNIDVYADPWRPGDDLAAESLMNAMAEGPYYVNWTAPDDQATHPDAVRHAFAVELIWRMAAVPPW